MLHLISIMENQGKKNQIRNLHLERVNCSTTCLFKFCRSIEDFKTLSYLSLAGNHLPYFCIDGLLNQERLPEYIDLSDTRMDDLSAHHLLQGLFKRRRCEVKELSLAKNPLLGFAFFSKVSEMLSEPMP